MGNHRHIATSKAAYLIWEHFGRPDGRDLEFWYLAERLIPFPLPWGYPDSEERIEARKRDHSLVTCECEICQYSRKVREVMESRDPDRLITTITEMMNATYSMGFELNMLQVVMNGSWPSAVEQLEEALEKAKAIREREKSETEL